MLKQITFHEWLNIRTYTESDCIRVLFTYKCVNYSLPGVDYFIILN